MKRDYKIGELVGRLDCKGVYGLVLKNRGVVMILRLKSDGLLLCPTMLIECWPYAEIYRACPRPNVLQQLAEVLANVDKSPV